MLLRMALRRSLFSPSISRTTTFRRPPRLSLPPCRRLQSTLRVPENPSEPPLSLYEGISLSERVGNPGVRNQIVFFVVGSTVLFTYAAWRTNLETEIYKEKLMSTGLIFGPSSITSVDLRRLQHRELGMKLRAKYEHLVIKAKETNNILRAYVATSYATITQPWLDAGHGKRLCWEICMANAFVYLMWKLPRMHPLMIKNFMHHPLSGKSFTMLTSTFSHMGIFHLFLNCYALEGFGSSAANFLLREQERTSDQLESTPAWHFLAFYCSAGVFASLVQHVVDARFIYPRMVKSLASASSLPAKRIETWSAAVASTSAGATAAATAKTAPTISSVIKPGLGASGAVYACVTMTALAYPEAQIALAIPPSYPVNIQWGVGALLTMDIVGALRGWTMLAHWAHLGGAAFGAAYYYGGMQMWNGLRQGMSVAAEKP